MAAIKTKRLLIRPFRKNDEESLIENINDRIVYRYTLRIPYPYTKRRARLWIATSSKTHKQKMGKIYFAIAINGKAIGGIGLDNIEKHKAEIGYWLGQKYWGKGIMTEAVIAVTKYAFDKLKVTRVYASIFVPNKASARVLEKSGYKYEGRLRKAYIKDGKCIDAYMYAQINRNT